MYDSGTLSIKSLMYNEWIAADPMDFRARGSIYLRKKSDGWALCERWWWKGYWLLLLNTVVSKHGWESKCCGKHLVHAKTLKWFLEWHLEGKV